MIASYLTTEEIKQYKNSIVLIPYGSFEQHGPYLPLITDSAIAESICERIEQTIPDKVLLYPTLWIGDSSEHDGFDGTLSLKASTSIKVLEEIFTWLQKSQFKKCIVYNAHGGNVNLGRTIAEDFSRANNLKVKFVDGFSSSFDKAAIDLFGYSEPHAGSVETSLLYTLRPNLRKTDKIVIEGIQKYPGNFSLFKTKDLSESGILNGDTILTIDIKKAETLISIMEQDLTTAINKMLDLKL